MAAQAVTASRTRSTETIWQKCWLPYVNSLALDPYLSTIKEKIPTLLVFATRVRDGRLSLSKNPVRAERVLDALLAVAKAFTSMGASDPRFNSFGSLDIRLAQLLRGMRNGDPAPTRVQPLPIQLLHFAQSVADASATPQACATINLAWIAYFFLLRPGEYANTSSETAPLKFRQIGIFSNQSALDPITSDAATLLAATHATIPFEQQKTRHKGEVIAHASSPHHAACPVKSLVRRILHIRNSTSQITDLPICSFFNGSTITQVTSQLITVALQQAAIAQPTFGITPSRIEARSLRAGGAMALLCANVDSDVVKLVGRWRSDAMFRYLHAQTLPIVQNLSRSMITYGQFTLAPEAIIPNAAQRLLDAAAAVAPPS